MLLLPLRLAAEPVCRARLGNCFVLPSKDDDERVCMIVGEGGLLALALAETTDTPDDEALARALGIDVQCLPCQRVVVNATKSSWTGHGKHRDAVAQQCDCSDAAHAGCLVPQRIVEGIHRYYARQVLEPSIRGFLSILEKQFPRNDLYLFELLQNAVDDGASIVSFATTRDGLEFTHNGKRFTALDVLGLASVGLSTKGSDGTRPKRTIGFMGVGFKAVYKRYSRVVIGDDRYGFAFKEQQQQQAQGSSTMPGHGWVMLPVWAGPVSKSGPQAGWCRFLLEAPRGGVASIAADMRNLPRTVVPLLGRQSLENAGTAEWTLEWDGARHRVSRPVKAAARGMAPDWFAGSESLDVETGSAIGSGFSSQQQQQRTATTRWQFVTLRFSPDDAARKAYETHIKRPWVGGGSGPGAQCEETCFFFELDAASGIPVCSAKGNVHAVLPTKLSLPCPLQWQGSWLLSVDRQEVQSVTDNDWNACLLKQAPKLLASLLSWVVGASDPRLHSPVGLRAVFYLFPQMERGSSSSSPSPSLSSFLLGQRISMQPLADYMASNAVVPVRRRDGSLGWLPSSKVVWLPPSVVTRMPAAMLERWMGLLPLATDALCDGTAYLPLWRHCLTFPRQLAKTRIMARDALRLDGAGLSSLHAAISLMAAFGEVISVDVDKASTLFSGAASRPKTAQAPSTTGAKGDKADGKEDGAQLCGSWLPSLAEWPIFFTERGTELTASEVVWLSEDFAALPPDVLRLLRDGALLVCRDRAREGGGGGTGGRELLEPNIEMFVLTGNLPPRAAVISPWRLDDAQHAALDGDKTLLPACRALFAACREAHATCVVTPVEACAGLLGKYAHAQARGAPLSAAELAACEALFLWAFSSGLPQALTHVLAGPAPKLVAAGEAYLDSCYLPEAAWLQGLVNGSGMPALQLVSQQYLQRAGGDRAAVCRFLLEAGVRRGLALCVTSRSLSPAQLSALSIALPKLRAKNPAAPLSLPFNLGAVSKSKLYEVDSVLSAEWTSVLSGKLSPAQAASVVESVVAAMKQAEAADPATPEAVPSAANLLRGKEEQSTCVRTGTTPPGFDHRCYLPTMALTPLLKRLYFLPPGQAGGSALSLGLASFVRSLAVLRWIPCAAPGAPAEAPASLVCPPSECVLDASSGAATEMPTVRLPPALAKALSQLPPVVLKEFAFGSVKPRPPVDKLEALAVEAERVDRQAAAQGVPDAQADEHLFFELVGVWRAIGAALREGRLSSDEQKRVLRVCQAGGSVLPTSPESPRRRVSLGRVVALAAPSADLKDEELAAAALVKVGFLLNLREPAYALDAGLCLLLRPPSAVSAEACCDFLCDLFLRVLPKLPGGPSAPAPGPALKRAVSWAMWVGMRPLLGPGATAAPSPAVRAAFVKKVPGLSVFCRRGPGFSPQAYPARWLLIDAAASAQTQPMPVLPVLTDDEAVSGRRNGVSKAAMLMPSHAYQPLGMLDHALIRERDSETTRLAEREKVVLAVLGIPQTSAADQFSLKTTVSGKGEPLLGPSKRLEIVVLLLSMLKAGAGNFDGSLGAMQMPALTRYQSIALVFKTPRMAEPERRSVFAVWGAGASAASPTRALFIAASPEDYAAELEGLVLALVYGPSIQASSSTPSERPTKVLRLLSFLEDEEKFLKFLHRDFGAFIPAEEDHGQPEEAPRGDSSAAMGAEQGKEEGKEEEEKEGRESGKEGGDGADEAARLHGQLRASILGVFLDKQQRERERGRRDDKRPALALSLADDASPLDPAKRSRPSDSPPNADATASSAFGAQAAAVLADAFLSRLTASVPSGRGRGGVSNLPAWMTEPGRSLLISSEPSVSAPEPGSPKSAPPQQGQFDDQEEEGEGGERQAKGAGAALSPSAAAVPQPGRAAGRGLAATLPAWMTASTALGQEQEWSEHTRGLGDRLLQKFGISGPALEPASDPASASSSSTSAQTAAEEATPPEASSQQQQQQQQGDKRKAEAEAAPPARQQRGRTNEAASRQLIDRLAAFISELQRALTSNEVEVEWAKELLASAIEQLTS